MASSFFRHATKRFSSLYHHYTPSFSSNKGGACALVGTSMLFLVEIQRQQQKSKDEGNVTLLDSASRDHGKWDKISKLYSSISPYKLNTPHRCQCETAYADNPLTMPNRTETMIEVAASSSPLSTKYEVNYDATLGEGGFAAVFLGKNIKTNEKVAVKVLDKNHLDPSFEREMEAMIEIRDAGGHPNICGLRDTYKEGGFYYLILDLVNGEEMFEHLCQHGAYSEADSAHHARDIASALAFMHGIGCVHGDLKPENLMLSSKNIDDAVVKIIDFGCAQVETAEGGIRYDPMGCTPSYSPAEVLDKSRRDKLYTSDDMWALGVIMYIMLTGYHPFYLDFDRTDSEVTHSIISKERPPLSQDSDYTAHLSESAIDLLSKLLECDPEKRISAQEMLHHPWTQGKTARRDVMVGSDTKLAKFKRYISSLQAAVFADAISWSNELEEEEEEGHHPDQSTKNMRRGMSLFERSFRKFDDDNSGSVDMKEMVKALNRHNRKYHSHVKEDAADSEASLSLTGFSDLLGESMENKYFPKDHIISREGDIGDEMYFIESGFVQVTTPSGFQSILKQGQFLGEGALLRPSHKRSSLLKCLTPVHVISIHRDYFEKYLLANEPGLVLHLRDARRKRSLKSAKKILSERDGLQTLEVKKGDTIFKRGDNVKQLHIVKEGMVDVNIEGQTVFTSYPGDVCAEYAVLTDHPANSSGVCASSTCKLQVMNREHFQSIMNSIPGLKEQLQEVSNHRQFQKAVVFKTKMPFPNNLDALRKVFDVIDVDKSGDICLEEIRSMLLNMNPMTTEEEIQGILNSLDIDENGKIDFEEIKCIFGMKMKKKKSLRKEEHNG